MAHIIMIGRRIKTLKTEIMNMEAHRTRSQSPYLMFRQGVVRGVWEKENGGGGPKVVGGGGHFTRRKILNRR